MLEPIALALAAVGILSLPPSSGVPEGRVLEGPSILNLAPTILSHFGIEPPAHMDGRVLGEIAAAEPAGATG
jgi:hypothetical protein